MDYFIQCAVLVTIWGILAISIELVAGQAGLLSMAHAGFFGIGAYTSAFLTLREGCGFLIGLVSGLGIVIVVSFILSLFILRLNDDNFVIGTFVFQMILFDIMNNWTSVTHGSLGIRNIPPPNLFEFKINSSYQFLILTFCYFCFVFFIFYRISISPFGRVLHAIRENEAFAEANGKNTFYYKIIIFVISASVASSAGCFYAHFITYIDPTSFTMMESILIISMMIIGGPGSLWGPVLGAALLITLPEALRFIGFQNVTSGNMREVIYGCLLIGIMMFRPKGIAGKYGFDK